MNHSQQLELSLGKRTELICTPNINFNIKNDPISVETYIETKLCFMITQH